MQHFICRLESAKGLYISDKIHSSAKSTSQKLTAVYSLVYVTHGNLIYHTAVTSTSRVHSPPTCQCLVAGQRQSHNVAGHNCFVNSRTCIQPFTSQLVFRCQWWIHVMIQQPITLHKPTTVYLLRMSLVTMATNHSSNIRQWAMWDSGQY